MKIEMATLQSKHHNCKAHSVEISMTLFDHEENKENEKRKLGALRPQIDQLEEGIKTNKIAVQDL